MYQPKAPIVTTEEIKAILGPDFTSQTAKIIDHIDPPCLSLAERPG